MNLSLLAANVSPQVRIVSTNLSPRQLMFASQANDVCKPQHLLVVYLVQTVILLITAYGQDSFLGIIPVLAFSVRIP